jgi:hypothetical protein
MKAFSDKVGVLLLFATCAVAQSRDQKTSEQPTPLRAIAAARRMRDQLNDPDSLRVTSFFYYESAPGTRWLCVIFRAKNEHGGLILQTFINNGRDESAQGAFNPPEDAWSVLCKGHVTLDATDAVKAALKADREKGD